MERENGLKANRIRQAENLSILDRCFFHGTYYLRGQPQLPKEKRPVPISSGAIFNIKGEIIFGNRT